MPEHGQAQGTPYLLDMAEGRSQITQVLSLEKMRRLSSQAVQVTAHTSKEPAEDASLVHTTLKLCACTNGVLMCLLLSDHPPSCLLATSAATVFMQCTM
jgi:hypothetical protein